MTSLRHPNVVLFMAACTKPPKMCIVMEFMSLGSLYDVRTLISCPLMLWCAPLTHHALSLSLTLQLLHNELIPEVPFQLKVSSPSSLS
jgi:serine/threonine protein kinase